MGYWSFRDGISTAASRQPERARQPKQDASDLARREEISLGGVWIVPPTRSIVSANAGRVTIEPRVMQVLLKLVDAGGVVVTRAELIEDCWGGQIVADDSINRAISELRRAMRKAGADLVVETIPKIGYRLVRADAPDAAEVEIPPSSWPRRLFAHGPSRRHVLLAIGGGAVLGAGYLGWQIPSPQRRQAMALYEQGLDAQRQANLDSRDQAIAYFEHANRIDPDFAPAWGARALTLALSNPQGDDKTAATALEVRSIGGRALALDPRNRDATIALVLVSPYYRNWGEIDTQTRAAIARFPDHAILHAKLGSILSHTGRWRDGFGELSRAVAIEPLIPLYQLFLWRVLWGMGRIHEAQSLIDRCCRQWPDRGDLWLWRFAFFALRGMIDEVRAMDRPDSPAAGHPLIDIGQSCAQALASRDARAASGAIDAVLHSFGSGALPGVFAIPCLSALGAVDAAFATSYDFYLGKHDAVTGERQPVLALAHRETFMLFQPPTGAMRADPRFARLTALIGLDDYWRATGSRPDFRAA